MVGKFGQLRLNRQPMLTYGGMSWLSTGGKVSRLTQQPVSDPEVLRQRQEPIVRLGQISSPV